MHSEGSRFTWGSEGDAVFAESCVCVRNRSEPSATVCVTAATVCVSAVSSPQWRVRLERSGKCVKLTRGAAVILAFAEEVSAPGIRVAADILAFAEEVSV